MAREITDSMVAEALESGWSEVDARRGYGIFTSDFGNGVEHIELINEIGAFDSDEKAAAQAEKDGIKIIRNLEFIEGHEGFYIDTPENRQKLISVIKHDLPDDAVAFELNLYAEAYYSGATYDETIRITREDFLKLLVANGLNIDKLNDYEIFCGELDGKHSQVYGAILVTPIKIDQIEVMQDAYPEDGSTLFDHLAMEYELWSDRAELDNCPISADELNQAIKNFKEYLNEVRKYKRETVFVPVDKVDELIKFANKLCGKEMN